MSRNWRKQLSETVRTVHVSTGNRCELTQLNDTLHAGIFQDFHTENDDLSNSVYLFKTLRVRCVFSLKLDANKCGKRCLFIRQF